MDNGHDWTSRNVSGVGLSAIKDMAMRAAKVPNVASLAWGLPSFRTPEHIRRRVQEQLDADPDIGKYALPDGLPELRRVVAEQHQAQTGVATHADANVLITAGNMQGLNSLFHMLIDHDDEIIVTDPGFASHAQQIRLYGGKPVYWKMDETEAWRLDLDGLSDLITARTKAIVLVSPSNPTGKIFTETELRHVGEVARQQDLLILLDDPYRHFTYENTDKYFNLACVPEFADRVAYLFTFSKAHAMSGWRLGYMIVPAHVKEQALKVHDATIICTPRISQIAGLAALTGQSGHLVEFEQALGTRRELICERLGRVPHVFTYVKPEGAYYVFPKIVSKHADSYQFALDLLETAGVSVTPGSAFGPAGEHHVRMAYCVSQDTINTAFDRIEKRFPA
jgi:aspartate/methionine/tyrosine aminotransferase